MIAAVAGVVVLVLLSAFQVALACGAPWGRFAWGGGYPGVLPVRLRVGSALALVVYGFMALVLLGRAGVVAVLPDGVVAVGIWVMVGFLALSVIGNALSRSAPERYTMTPITAVLAALTLSVALG